MFGNAIDTIGFQDLLATLCVGTLKASTAAATATANLTVKLMECATANGTFTDITDGAINGTATVMGSAKFDVVACVSGSFVQPTPFKQRKLYVNLNTSTHKRYIRPHASITGSASCSQEAIVSVALLLGRPRDSSYIIDAVANATCDAFVAFGYKYGSTPGM